MKKYFILENQKKEGARILGETIENYLSEHGCEFTTLSGYMDSSKVPQGTECIITIGGDGTLITAATAACSLNIPIIGVNAGHLGYLTSISNQEEIPAMLQQLIEDKYQIIDCNTLTVNVDGREVECVVNEVTIGKHSPLHVVKIRISVDDEYLSDISADGIIVSTPTGSTAYNLSAGGSVIQTGMDAFAITPICVHGNIINSIVVDGGSEIELEIIDDGSSEPVATYDGREEIALRTGSKVTIKKGNYPIHFIRLGNETFISNLRKKLEALMK